MRRKSWRALYRDGPADAARRPGTALPLYSLVMASSSPHRLPLSRARLRIIAPLVLVAMLRPVAAQDCAGMQVHGDASAQEIQAVCRAAGQARDFLAACGIGQPQPLDIRIVPALQHPAGFPAFAYYDAARHQITLLDLDHFAALIQADSPYHLLPGPVAHASLTAHEAAHAIAFQHLAQGKVSRAGLEYIAAVVQLASLDADSRRLFLARFPRDGPVPLEALNGFSLYAAPHWFAANAYRHFAAADDGCGLLRDVLAGKVRFADHPE